MAPVKRGRILPFYGWYIVLAAFAAGFFSISTMNMVFSVMLKPMTEHLGWSRAALTGPGTLGVLAASFVSPFFGRLVDLRGPRLIASVSALAVGLSLVLLSHMDAMWQFYLLYIMGRVISYNGLQLVPSTAVANWFIEARAMAVGITAAGVPAGGAALAWISQQINQRWGWRSTWLLLGLAIWICLVAPLAWVLRRRPEDLGLLPDGASLEKTSAGFQPSNTVGPGAAIETSWTTGQAVRSSVFWFITAGLGLATLANSSVVLHLVAYITDRGFSSGMGTNAIVILAATGALSSLVWGWLAQRWGPRYALMAAMWCVVAGIMLLLLARDIRTVYLCAILIGLGGPGQMALQTIAYAAYFGRLNLGTIRGMAAPVINLGWALGPLISAFVYDSTQSYQFIFFFFGCMSTVGIILIALVKDPR